MKKMLQQILIAVFMPGYLLLLNAIPAWSAAGNLFVAAGHDIQEFNGQTSAFVGNVTTTWNNGSSNSELHFGSDNNLYGLGSNGWVYKYDFGSGQTTIFAKPTGDGGATGLAFRSVPEPAGLSMLLVGSLTSLASFAARYGRLPSRKCRGSSTFAIASAATGHVEKRLSPDPRLL